MGSALGWSGRQKPLGADSPSLGRRELRSGAKGSSLISWQTSG